MLFTVESQSSKLEQHIESVVKELLEATSSTFCFIASVIDPVTGHVENDTTTTAASDTVTLEFITQTPAAYFPKVQTFGKETLIAYPVNRGRYTVSNDTRRDPRTATELPVDQLIAAPLFASTTSGAGRRVVTGVVGLGRQLSSTATTTTVYSESDLLKLQPYFSHLTLLVNGIAKYGSGCVPPKLTGPTNSADTTKLSESTTAIDSLKHTFLATMSHEIRTPLNGIVGSATLLQESRPLTSEQETYVNILSECSAQLLNLISDILDFSRIHNGTITLVKESFDIRECIKKSMDIVRHKANDKKLTLVLDIAPDFPDKIVCDPLRLSQVLINLLGNAIKFTESGYVRLKAHATKERINWNNGGEATAVTTTTIGSFRDNSLLGDIRNGNKAIARRSLEINHTRDLLNDNGSGNCPTNGTLLPAIAESVDADYLIWNLQFEVQDTGRGVKLEDRERIFEMFTRVKTDERDTIDQGIGLGLTISKRLIELMGGAISVSDRVRASASALSLATTHGLNPITTGGTSFTFNVKADVDLDPRELVLAYGDLFKDKIVVIVDDREENRLLLMQTLLKLGMRVHSFGGAKEALMYLDTVRQFDLAIIDVYMPGMNGVNLVQAIREHGFLQPLVGMSSVGEDIAGKEWFDYFIQKPITEVAIGKAMIKCLRSGNNSPRSEASSLNSSGSGSGESASQVPQALPVSPLPTLKLPASLRGSPIFTPRTAATISTMNAKTVTPPPQRKSGVRRRGASNLSLATDLTKDTVKLLVAEDDHYNRLVMSKMLESLGYKNVTIVNDGQECVAAVQRETFHICLMDVKMPRVNGIQATKTIKTLDNYPFIIAVSASVLDSDVETCMNAGMDAYISKPVDKGKLERTLHGLLTRRL